MTEGLTRRDFLKLTSLGALGLAMGWELQACGDGEEAAAQFFTAEERATVEAAVARILPALDGVPGALEAGAANYIDAMLAAFDRDPPLLFAGGPFSGRLPFPDNDTGTPSGDRPDNAFERFLPLPRTLEIAWRIRLYGSTEVPDGNFNDPVLGPTTGLRTTYREGLTAIDAKGQELFQAPFADLAPEQQDQVLTEGDQAFVRQLIENALEGAYCLPEYGGNNEMITWKALGYEGESQPLGYSIFDRSTGAYKELPDKPVSTKDPDDAEGFDDEVIEFLSNLIPAIGGKRFF